MNIALFFTRDGNIQLGDTFQNTEGEYSVSLKAASGFSTNFSDIRLGDSIAETVTISNDGTKETITLNLKMPAEGPDDNSDSKYLSPCTLSKLSPVTVIGLRCFTVQCPLVSVWRNGNAPQLIKRLLPSAPVRQFSRPLIIWVL